MIFDEFGHRCWFHFDIPLGSKSMFLGDRFCWWFVGSICVHIWLPWITAWPPFFRHLFAIFFRALLPFTKCKIYKCQEQLYHLLFSKNEECYPHLCLLLGKTYKCAVTVFTILQKNAQRKQARGPNAPRLDLGAILANVGTLLAPCWSLLAPFWFNVGRLWHLCESILILVHQHPSFRHPNLRSTRRQPRTPSPKEFYLPSTSSLNRPGAGPCRRHINRTY